MAITSRRFAPGLRLVPMAAAPQIAGTGASQAATGLDGPSEETSMLSRRYFLSGVAAIAGAGTGSALAGTKSMSFDSNIVLAQATVGQGAGAAQRIPLRDFFKNPEKSGFQVSPDGNNISFMQSYERRMNVFVQPRAGGAAVRVTGETERDVAGYF